MHGLQQLDLVVHHHTANEREPVEATVVVERQSLDERLGKSAMPPRAFFLR